MPYYSKVTNRKSSGQKRSEAEKRGGFEDEGSRYSGTRKSSGGTAKRQTSASSKSANGETRSYTRKTSDGAPYAKRTGSAPKRDGAPRPYARKTEGGETYAKRPYDKKPGSGDTRSYASAGESGKPYQKREGAPRPYTRKTEGGETYAKRPYDKKPGSGDTRSYASAGESGKPYQKREGAPRPYTRKSEGGDSYGKRPYDKKPRNNEMRTSDGKSTQSTPRGPRTYSKTPAWSTPHFVPQSAYRSRGENITPKPYDQQKREQVKPDYNAYRTATPQEETVSENLLSGRNPIREALKSGRDIEKLMVSRGELSGSAREIVAMAKEQHIPVQEVDRARLDAITPHHQGMLAFASAYQYHTVDEMLALAKSRNEKPFLVMLDGVTDPHNLGAVIRTAECAGAHGVIVQERRAVGLTPAAVKASAGAIEHIMVARVVNLTATLDTLKQEDIWAYAAASTGEDYAAVDFSGGAVIVIGAEGEGVSRLVMEKCDKTVALPIRGKIDSLNASVAAGILLYAVLRSR